MSVIYFDDEMREAFRKIGELVDMFGIRYGGTPGIKTEEKLSDTQIKDKKGVVYDLAELVKTTCVIANGCGGVFTAIRADVLGPMAGLFVSSAGKHFSPEALAKLIRKHEDDPDYLVTVHKF